MRIEESKRKLFFNNLIVFQFQILILKVFWSKVGLQLVLERGMAEEE